MAEKLGEIGNVLKGIGDAVKTMKALRDKNGELYRVTEDTKEHAGQVEQLDLPDEPQLAELKQELRKVRDSGSRLEVWIKSFGDGINEFERFLKAKVAGSAIPQEVIKEFCDQLLKMRNMAKDFSDAFESFIGHLSKSQQLAIQLTDRLRQRAEEMERQADSMRNRGVAGTAGLAVLGAGLVSLGFFTGGATWVAAGAVAGAVCGVGAGVVARSTSIDVKAMRELASGILTNSNKLGVLASSLKSSSDRAGAIQLDKEAAEALQTALEFFRRDLEKNDVIAQQQMELQDAQAELAELKAKMRRHGIE